ncbi:ATP-binding cassette domain-containing protein [Salinicoccus sp. ID82-1]|uniref:ABC transporter ATP-binding protein n=1 Tax=Salinicoccus sp. ID82-1 TaxID=2820269 RepID=UPI001F0294EE|nr:ABC transporter ATP-binding protein [Salinicoccus sp. ID82-1]MCG1008758.1 ATP-binding cassette domain-containing protein [Salinicoccus sp. ID82-1]
MAIAVKNLRLKFPEAQARLFTDLELTIEDKEKVLIVGPSGSGKSTLLNVLGGLIPNVIDVPMKADQLELPNSGAYVFQDPDSQFTMPTVAEELAFIMENRQVEREDMDQRIVQILSTVGLDIDPAAAIHTLSGGMKQKLAIASALLQQADTLFLDEPTSMLDEGSAEHLWETIQQMWDGRTVVIIEHRVENIWDKVDRVILMDDQGRIDRIGPPDEMLENHRDALDAFGVWHPESWHNAPRLPEIKAQSDVLLEARDLVVRRGKRQLLTIDALDIWKGEWITLEGDNGTGKTSLLLALMKLIPSDGDIQFKIKKVKKQKHYNGALYPVFQNPELQFITNTVFDEVFINLELHFDREEAKQKADALIERLGLGKVRHLHPLEISTGQKRRLSVATAAGGIPEIIILDEPTFGLDQRHAFRLLQMLHDMVKSGTTIIMITHDEEIKIRYPSRRLRIEDGTLMEGGGSDD